MRLRPRAASLGWAVALLVLGAGAPSAQGPSPGRVPTVSRLVLQFTEREMQLAARLGAHDAEGAGKLLTDDFELRAGAQPGRPVPRADWMHESMRSGAQQAAPTQMAVHDLGDAAVVSFLQPGPSANASFFVVDVWRREGEAWKLAIRYVARSASGGPALPGVPPAERPIPKRY